jgi:outer membrane receptor protein involved in Fe transport
MGDTNFRGATASQELKAVEFGWKQRLLNGRVYVNLTAWQYKWENRPFGVLLVFFRDAEDPADRDGIPLPFPNNTNQTISGSQELDGIEFESGGAITENWTAQLNVSWSQNKFTQFEDRNFERITGVTNYKGLLYQGYPEWMGNLNLTYRRALKDDWEWYARSDLIYRGEYYAENLNLAQAPDYLLVHVRVGFMRDDLRLELFVRNLFDTDDWREAVTRSDFTTLLFDFQTIRGILVQPQEKRTVGIRVSMAF